MQILRKLIICLITFVVCLAAFFGYRLIVKPPVIAVEKPQSQVIQADPESKFTSDVSGLGDTVIGETTQSEYKVWDKENSLKRKFGFSKLLHLDGKVWQVELPYMVIYEKNFECRIDAQKGSVRVDEIAGKYIPTDATLDENVKISVKSKQPGKEQDCQIFLDDLDYTNERCEFTTSGPIRMFATDASLIGNGMTLIFNSERNRVELLKISKIDHLTIKNFEDNKKGFSKSPSAVSASQAEAKSEHDSAGVQNSLDIETADQQATAKAEMQYECILSDNVRIETPDNTVSAQKISISNILWGSKSNKSQNESLQNGDTLATSKSAQSSARDSSQDENAIPGEVQPTGNIVVTCDGPLILRPIDSIFDDQYNFKERSVDNTRIVRLEGDPVVISDTQSQIAQCGILRYDIDSGCLNMCGSEKADYVKLDLDENDGHLYTTGNVNWNSKNDLVVVQGPGTMSISSSEESGEPENFEMSFNGIINLHLDKNADLDASSDYKVKLIDLKGGMHAFVKNDDDNEVRSKDARIEFAENNQISKALLDGDVLFKNSKGAVTSENATLAFEVDDQGKSRLKDVVANGDATLAPVTEKLSRQYPTTFHAQTINYDLVKDYVFAQGPVELSFFVFDKENIYAPSPVVVTASDSAQYYVQMQEVVFNGSVFGKLVQDRKEFEQISTFDSQKLTISLNNQESGSEGKIGVSKLELTGGNVELVSTRKTGDDLIHKILLNCDEIIYDGNDQKITAYGDGVIKINNSGDKTVAQNSDGISMRGPCYALVENFDTLEWFTEKQKISAKSADKLLHVGYVPLLADGTTGQEKLLDTGRIEADFVELPDGKLGLQSMLATESVLYEEPGRHQFVGDSLKYDSQSQILRVMGSDRNPCMIDNNLADNIIYNVATGDFEATVKGSTSIPVKSGKPKKK